MKYRLGIDVGGTNTDAVILDENHQVVAKCKRPTSEDISTGINQAVETVLKESAVAPSAIQHAMLGTTHATNAIVERKGLAKVGVLRLGAPCGLALPPMMDWPEDMPDYIGNHHKMVKGGFEYDGKLTVCCPNPILVISAAASETQDFLIFFFDIDVNA